MAGFRLVDASAKEVWSTDYMREYVRESGFLPFMSSASTAIIRTEMSLTKENGEVVHIPYFRRLTGNGITGATSSYGLEDNLANYSKAIKATYRRNVVMIPESEKFRTDLDVANVARPALKDWSAERLRDDLIGAMQSVVIKGANDADGLPGEDTSVSYATATAGQRNDYLANNSDRILFGALKGNNTGTFSTSLANIDTTGDKLTVKMVRVAKAMAKKTNAFKIRPVRTDATAGREWFTLFVGSEGFRDLCADPELGNADADARARDAATNPLFQGGDRIIDGIIIREIPEMGLITGAGAAGSNVGTAFLCGSQALGVAWAMKPEPRTEVRDGGFENRQYIVEIRGQEKLSFGGVQSGMVSIYHSASDDA